MFAVLSDRTVHLVTADFLLSFRIPEPQGWEVTWGEVQPPAQSRATTEHSWGCSELCPVGSSKSPRVEDATDKPFQCLIILIMKIIFLLFSPFSVYDYCPSLAIPPYPRVKSLALSSHWPLPRCWKVALWSPPNVLDIFWNTSLKSVFSQTYILLCQGKNSQLSHYPFAAVGPKTCFHWSFWGACGNVICQECDYYCHDYSLL